MTRLDIILESTDDHYIKGYRSYYDMGYIHGSTGTRLRMDTAKFFTPENNKEYKRGIQDGMRDLDRNESIPACDFWLSPEKQPYIKGKKVTKVKQDGTHTFYKDSTGKIHKIPKTLTLGDLNG